MANDDSPLAHLFSDTLVLLLLIINVGKYNLT